MQIDWMNIIIAVTSVIATILSFYAILSNKFDELKKDIRQIDCRLSRLEGFLHGRDNFLTGTENDSKK